jgi:hypothetical protein
LAINTMQTMTKINWLQRVTLSVDVATGAVLMEVMFRPWTRLMFLDDRSESTWPGQGHEATIVPAKHLLLFLWPYPARSNRCFGRSVRLAALCVG